MLVAIIGANSFLAQYIIRSLILHGLSPHLWGISPSEEFKDLSFSIFKIPESPIAYKSILEYDAIIYTAGAGVQANLKEEPELVYELNAFQPIKLINYLIENKFNGKFISFGSYFEIGNEKNPKFYSEREIVSSSNTVPNHYSLSKRLLSRYWDSVYEKIDFFHLILPNLYGKGENPNRIIPYLINALEKHEEIKLTSGMQVRQFIHAKDVAESVYSILINKYPYGIFNLCYKSPIKIRDLVIEVFEIMGYNPINSDNLFGSNERSDTAMQYLLMDNSKALSTFHFQPQITLKDGIKLYL